MTREVENLTREVENLTSDHKLVWSARMVMTETPFAPL